MIRVKASAMQQFMLLVAAQDTLTLRADGGELVLSTDENPRLEGRVKAEITDERYENLAKKEVRG